LIISGVGIMNIMLVTYRTHARDWSAQGRWRKAGRDPLSVLMKLSSSADGPIIGIAIAVGVKIIVEPLIPAEVD